jgi:hypothetical protein
MRLRPSLRLACLTLGLCSTTALLRAQSNASASSAPQATSFDANQSADADPLSTLEDLLDRIPDFSALNLPSFVPTGLSIHSSPHFGDLIHRPYLRVPVGGRWKMTSQFETHGELEGYFRHGLRNSNGESAYGLDRWSGGFKFESPKPPSTQAAWSTGADFSTPLGRPPLELTDGHRHFVPYVAMSRIISLDQHLFGYSSVGVDLLSHAGGLPANFGRNELHSDSMIFSAGLARDWPKFRTSLTANFGTTSLISDENHHVFGLRPAIVFPLPRFQGKHTRIIVTVGGWSVWGPDGHEIGASASMRVDFRFHPGARKPSF